jgi:hypothetical protein
MNGDQQAAQPRQPAPAPGMADQAPGHPAERLAEQIDAYCHEQGWDLAAEVTTGADSAWACQLTLILTPNRPDGPDRSLVTFATNRDDPATVLSDAWDDMQAWLAALPAAPATTKQPGEADTSRRRQPVPGHPSAGCPASPPLIVTAKED